ncbi:MAG: hypothetical protein HY695_17145 [Deltaproteobacteria bacterium]|nr:hypothetical protein [Deltaproteobacteria bacterium]
MTEAAAHFFGHYSAVKKAVASFGIAEFEEEPSFVTSPSSSACWAAKTTVVTPCDVDVETGSQDYPQLLRVAGGSGQTQILFLRYARNLVRLFGILPATLITSEGAVTLITFVQGGSMATQQSPTTEDESVEEIIWRVATTLSVPYRERLTVRLSELQKAVKEEELDGRGITVTSLHHFVEFLKLNPAVRCPAVSVTPDRNIYASWKSGPDRVFSVHFLPNGKVRFVIFCPNDKHPGEVVRLSGTATVDVVMSIAAPHGVLSWT